MSAVLLVLAGVCIGTVLGWTLRGILVWSRILAYRNYKGSNL